MAMKNLVCIDYEFEYDKDLTLDSRRTGYHDYVDFIHNPRFRIIGMGYKTDNSPKAWAHEHEVKQVLLNLELNNPDTYTVGHNMRTDGSITIFHYGLPIAHPTCTILMGRCAGASHLAGDSLEEQCKLIGREKTIAPAWEHLQRNQNSAAALRVLLSQYYWRKGGIPNDVRYYLEQRFGSRLWGLAEQAKETKSIVHNMEGKTVASMTQDEYDLYCCYGGWDADNCHALARAYEPYVCPREMETIELHLNMYFKPTIKLDAALLRKELDEFVIKKEEKVDSIAKKASVDTPTFKKILSSGEQFMVYALLCAGVAIPSTQVDKQTWYASVDTSIKAYNTALPDGEVQIPAPVKWDATKNKWALNMGKKSPLVKYLSEQPEDTFLRDLYEVRIAATSNIAFTRMTRFYDKAVRYPFFHIPIEYAKAHTGRGGGADKLNVQNLPSRNGSPVLRKSLTAPPGYLFVSCDSSQVEARLSSYFCNEAKLVSVFANGQDPYTYMASIIFGIPYDELIVLAKGPNKTEQGDWMRAVGKQTILACGYQMGHQKFSAGLVDQNVWLDKDLLKHQAMAKSIVETYRSANSQIKNTWYACDKAIRNLAKGISTKMGGPYHDMVHFTTAYRFGKNVPCIHMNGYTLFYPGLREIYEDGRSKIQYAVRKGKSVEWKYIYGGKVLENIIQAMAFCILKAQGVIMNRYYPLAINVHDEWGAIVPEAKARHAEELFIQVMSTAPTWAPGLPLAAEAMVHQNFYGG